MKEKERASLVKWMGVATKGYQYLLALFGIIVLAGISVSVSASFAAEPGAGSGAFAGFNDYICAMFILMGRIVGGVAVVMIIAAGIMYAASGGSDKGAVSIGSAKSMIVSALSGVALYLLGSLLLGQCGVMGYGALLRGIF